MSLAKLTQARTPLKYAGDVGYAATVPTERSSSPPRRYARRPDLSYMTQLVCMWPLPI